MFPNFAASCAALQSLLMPVAYLFLVTGHGVVHDIGRSQRRGRPAIAGPDHRVHHRAHAVGELGQSDCHHYRQHGHQCSSRQSQQRVPAVQPGVAGSEIHHVPKQLVAKTVQCRHVNLRGAHLRSALDLRLAGQRYRVLCVPGPKVHSLPGLRSFADLHRLSGDPRPEFNRHELPVVARRRHALAAGVGRGIVGHGRTDHVHDRPEFSLESVASAGRPGMRFRISSGSLRSECG